MRRPGLAQCHRRTFNITQSGKDGATERLTLGRKPKWGATS